MRGKWLLLSGVLILIAVALGALSVLRRESGPAQPPKTAAAAPPAFTAPEASLGGRVQARKLVNVPVPVDGTVESFLTDVGQEVHEGQLLAQITNVALESERDAALTDLQRAQSRVSSLESRLIAARLEASRARADASRARNDADKSEKTYLRQQLLFREGASSRITFERSQAQFESDKTEFEHLDEMARLSEQNAAAQMKELDEAKRAQSEKSRQYEEAGDALASAQVLSPVDGLIVGRRGQAGQDVTIEMEDLFQIAVDLAELEVVLEPEPQVLERIRPGQEAVVQIAEILSGIPGKVREVKDNRVLVEFTSPDPAVKPGMMVHVRIRLT
jgi:multidrug efflux pump subunit AcrA (membrane-fusion protein)